jgi:leader peptidase (prepilin peptidase)/N-methyltransferase
MTIPSAASPWCAVVAALAGAVLGRLLRLAVCRWFAATGASDDADAAPWWIEPASAAVAVATWWWEVRLLGQMPAAFVVAAGTANATIVLRYAAHLALFWLLAAATWIDLRKRVIPDWITVPGVLAGLLCIWARPDLLLPIAREVPRSFAGPALEVDVLGFLGGLEAPSAVRWLEGMPHLGGLALALGIYAAWWAVCTDPFFDATASRRVEPRNLILVLGVAAIVAAWCFGTDRFRGLQSALVGMAVSGGIVWALRAGASRALGREAMGLGDVTLMAMVGAWLGWQACVLAFFMAAFIGLAHGLFQLARHRESELPFGPSLCLASTAVVAGWRSLWGAVGVHFEEPGQMAVVIGAVVVLTAVSLSLWRHLRASQPDS